MAFWDNDAPISTGNTSNVDFNALEDQNGLPRGVLTAVMKQESGGNANAVSPKGASGPFQFMPGTAQQLGVNDPTDINQAAPAAAKYLGQLKTQFGGDLNSALAAYNWGPGNVAKNGMNNLPAETDNYVKSIGGQFADVQQPQQAQASNFWEKDSPITANSAINNQGLPPGVQLAQPNNFIERLGMASAGDQTQQTDVARQTALYSKNALQGLLSIPDAPSALINSGAALARTAKDGGSFVGNLGDLVSKDPLAPNLGQKFGNFADQYNNQVVPADNQEKVIASGFQGAGATLPFGPLATASGVASGAIQQYATNHGASPDQAAALGLLAGGAILKAPEAIQNVGSSIGEGASTMAKGGLFKTVDAKDLMDTASDLKANYEPNYNAVAAAKLTPESTAQLNQTVKGAIQNLDPDLHPDTIKTLQRIDNETSDGNSITLGQANTFRKLLQKNVGDNMNVRGQINEDGGVSGNIKSAIDNHIQNLTPDDFLTPGEGGITGQEAIDKLNQANASYSSGKRYQAIAQIVENSAGDIGKIQSGVRNFINKPKNMGGFSAQEVDALQNFANNKGNMGSAALGALASMGIDANHLLNPLTMISNATKLGAAAYGGVSPGIIAGTIAKPFYGALKRGQLQNAMDVIQARGTPGAVSVNTPANLPAGNIMKLPPAQALAILNQGRGVPSNVTIPAQGVSQ